MEHRDTTKIITAPRRAFVSIGILFLFFVISALYLSHYTGAPLTPPTERVSRALGFNYAIPFLVAIVGYVLIQVVVHFKNHEGTPLTARLRAVLADSYFLLLFVGVMYIHFQIKAWMPLINPVMYDDLYMTMEERWLAPLLTVMGWIRGLIARISSFDFLYQLGFVSMFAAALWGHAFSNRQWYYHNMYALLLMEMVGVFTYLITPAVGPFVFEPGPNEVATEAQTAMLAAFRQVQEHGAEWLAVNGGNYFTGPPAAMPSLHIAGATIILYYMLKIRSVFLPFIIFMFIWIFIESVVSRWHYFIDLPPGIFSGNHLYYYH